MRGFMTAKTYQATDVARRSRDVLDSGRAGGALIRDKDGTALLLAPAEDVARSDELAVLAADFVRLRRAASAGHDDVGAYGNFAWVTVFDLDARRQLATELEEPLLVALSGGPLDPLLDVIEDWRATARTWADEALREELLEPADTPLHGITL